MTVLYLDGIFVLNLLMDYLILLLTARLAGVPLRRWRYLLASLLGGAYAVAVFLPGWGILSSGPVKAAAGALMAVIAFGGGAYPVRLTLLMLAVSCGLAGCVLMLGGRAGGYSPLCGLAIGAAVTCGTLGLVFRAAARHGMRGELLPVKVCMSGRTVELTALWDSGNGLTTEGTRPVLVVAPGVLRSVLSADVESLLTEERLQTPTELPPLVTALEPSLFPQLLPFRAVGVSGRLLLAIRTDWIQIGGNRMERIYVALSPTALGAGYGALWGGAV